MVEIIIVIDSEIIIIIQGLIIIITKGKIPILGLQEIVMRTGIHLEVEALKEEEEILLQEE